MTVTEDIRYIGVNDHEVDLFEGQYTVPDGMSYNSYVILDEKIAVMDTVDAKFGGEWLANLEREAPAGHRTTSWFSTWSLTTPQTSRFSRRSTPRRRSWLQSRLS